MSFNGTTELAAKAGLSMEYGPDSSYGYGYIGRYASTLREDETGKEFYESVDSALKNVCPGADIKCDWHEEGWYEG